LVLIGANWKTMIKNAIKKHEEVCSFKHMKSEMMTF